MVVGGGVYVCVCVLGERGGKRPSTNVSPVTSTNIGISPKTFSFNPFATLLFHIYNHMTTSTV